MRIQLSTLMLLCGLFGACVGWAVDRQQWQSERSDLMSLNSERDLQLFSGISTFANASRSADIFFDLGELEAEHTPDYIQIVETQLVTDLLDIFEHRTELEVCSRTSVLANFDACILARDVIKQLDCETTDQFFQLARSLAKYENPSHYPELHDADCLEYKSLHEFASKGIAILDQLLPGPAIH